MKQHGLNNTYILSPLYEMQTMLPQIDSLAAEVFAASRLILKLLKKSEGKYFTEITFSKIFLTIEEMFSHIEEHQL